VDLDHTLFVFVSLMPGVGPGTGEVPSDCLWMATREKLQEPPRMFSAVLPGGCGDVTSTELRGRRQARVCFWLEGGGGMFHFEGVSIWTEHGGTVLFLMGSREADRFELRDFDPCCPQRMG